MTIPGGLRSSFLGALLLIALGVTVIVTYRAYEASREHRAIVERVLSDYVAVASYQFGISTRIALHSCLRDWLDDVPADGIGGIEASKCHSAETSRFEIDFTSGRSSASHEISTELLGWMRDTIPRHYALRYNATWDFGMLIPAANGGDALIAFAIERESWKPVYAVGFVARSAVNRLIGDVVARSRLLPPELTHGLPDSMFFNVRATAPRVASQSTTGLYGKRAGLGPEFGDIQLEVSLKQASLDRVVTGGLPRTRGLELLGLFALAIGLVLSSLMLLRREAQLARLRSGFVSSVSHELRTPLAQIRMFAEMLLLGRVRNEADQRRSLEVIDKEARRLSHLVENVLQVARSENGGVRVNAIEARPAPIIRDTAESFLVLAEAKQIELRLELQEDIVVPIDSGAVRQIVLNLLDNAAKYGPTGQRVLVGLALFEDTARLWVDDEGPGVPARERERVFEPFYRARRDLQSHRTGSGIGLAVVRELAVLHGGGAWIEDAPHGGARVVIEFPSAYVAAESTVMDWAVA
ncbi:MAG: sensor histidine kinase [Gemmatimonadota bacterium]